MEILDYIPTYPNEPITRQELCTLTGLTDRKIRLEIQKAKEEKPIVNVGQGYYIATDPNDRNLQQYVRQELHRGREVFRSVQACRMLALEDTNQERIF